jgi:hypothetical protein
MDEPAQRASIQYFMFDCIICSNYKKITVTSMIILSTFMSIYVCKSINYKFTLPSCLSD